MCCSLTARPLLLTVCCVFSSSSSSGAGGAEFLQTDQDRWEEHGAERTADNNKHTALIYTAPDCWLLHSLGNRAFQVFRRLALTLLVSSMCSQGLYVLQTVYLRQELEFTKVRERLSIFTAVPCVSLPFSA